MNIAFYAPLKSPNHPVPSGDRLMARLLIRALEMAGHRVEVASELRSFMSAPDAAATDAAAGAARAEIARLLDTAKGSARPDLWLTYHPYYKAPDLIGPVVAERLAIPYATAEASYSKRRDAGEWRENQRIMAEGVRQAVVNFCFTGRDMAGLKAAIPEGRYERLPPFIDASGFSGQPASETAGRFVTVAMMRAGDKFESYRMLADALARIRHRDWTLSVVGDGPMAGQVHRLFSPFEAGRVEWLGERSAAEIATILQASGTYVWPGCGEAYGLAYLEAQASGLPVVAQSTAGVPEVVKDGVTGILTGDGDVGDLAAALERMLDNQAEWRDMGQAARHFVHGERSLPAASSRIDAILRHYLGARYAS